MKHMWRSWHPSNLQQLSCTVNTHSENVSKVGVIFEKCTMPSNTYELTDLLSWCWGWSSGRCCPRHYWPQETGRCKWGQGLAPHTQPGTTTWGQSRSTSSVGRSAAGNNSVQVTVSILVYILSVLKQSATSSNGIGQSVASTFSGCSCGTCFWA